MPPARSHGAATRSPRNVAWLDVGTARAKRRPVGGLMGDATSPRIDTSTCPRPSVAIAARLRRASTCLSPARIIIQRHGRRLLWAAIPRACCRPCSHPHRSKAVIMAKARPEVPYASAASQYSCRVTCRSSAVAKVRSRVFFDAVILIQLLDPGVVGCSWSDHTSDER